MPIEVKQPTRPPKKKVTYQSLRAKRRYEELVSEHDNHGRIHTVAQFFRIAEYVRLYGSYISCVFIA